jgi:hypothetical protein
MTSSTEDSQQKVNNDNNNVADANNEEQPDEDVVTPWDVVARNSKGVDYDKLISQCLFSIFN